MTRSRMARYEAEQMSIVDPRKISDEGAEFIVKAFEALMQAEDEAEEPDESDAVEEARDELDRAVLNVIDAENRLDEVKQAVTALVENRREGAGEETEVLVNRIEEKEVIDLEGVVADGGSSGDWIMPLSSLPTRFTKRRFVNGPRRRLVVGPCATFAFQGGEIVAQGNYELVI